MSQTQAHLKKKKEITTLKMHLKYIQVICRKVKVAVTGLVQTSNPTHTLQQSCELDEQRGRSKRTSLMQTR